MRKCHKKIKVDTKLMELYIDLLDTVKVLEAIRTCDPKEAIPFQEFLKKHGRHALPPVARTF